MKKAFVWLLCLCSLSTLVSCLGDEPGDKYADWRKSNNEFIDSLAACVGSDGAPEYEKITPDWATSIFVLMKWHNDRSLTQSNLSPLSNSTCDVIYEGRLRNGSVFDNSFTQTEHGDSIYRCRPNSLVPGFWLALTNMHVGDSVTVAMPYMAGYGVGGNSTILPYSSLVFDIKLKAIPAFETN